MKAEAQRSTSPARRPKLEPTRTVLLDAARVRVIKSNAPSLAELCDKFGNWPTAEVLGKVRS